MEMTEMIFAARYLVELPYVLNIPDGDYDFYYLNFKNKDHESVSYNFKVKDGQVMKLD